MLVVPVLQPDQAARLQQSGRVPRHRRAIGRLRSRRVGDLVFRFRGNDGGPLARSEESLEGFLANLLRGYRSTTLDKGSRSFLEHLKVEAEQRAATG